VARLSKRYRVCLTSGIYGEDYVRLLNRARIVFNRSIRGEINMRVYEAGACGALMMYERENCEIRDLYREGQECVLYGDDVEQLIEYYLAHESEREQIAEAAARRVRGNTWAHSSAHILNAVEAVREGITIGANRSFCRLSAADRKLRRTCQWLLTPTHGGNRALEALQEIAGAPEHGSKTEDPEVFNALACAQADSAFAMPEGSALRDSGLRSALESVSRALEMRPGYLAAEFNRAHFLLALGDRPGATDSLRRTVIRLRAGQVRDRQLHGPYPSRFDSFRTELEQVFASFPVGSEIWSGAMRSLLLWRSAEMLSDLAYERGDMGESLAWARTAVRARPDIGTTRHRLARALCATGNLIDAEIEYRHALADVGLYPQLWTELARLLIRTRQVAACRSLLDDVSATLDGCPVYYWYRPELTRLRSDLEALGDADRPLRLLAFPNWHDAADWQELIREYTGAFSASDPVTLLLPIDAAVHPPVDSAVESLERFVQDVLGRSLETVADITLLTDSPAEVVQTDNEVVLVASAQDDSVPDWAASLPRVSRERFEDARRLMGTLKAA
jgi:tetratricopeptide (TPR) repeat protein